MIGASSTPSQPEPAPSPDALVLYPGFGTAATGVIEGRVIDAQLMHPFAKTDHWRRNLHRNLRLLLNAERPQYPVSLQLQAQQWHAISDAEGYFRVELGLLQQEQPGWHRLSGTARAARDEADFLWVPPMNVHGVISDVDDTILITHVVSLHRMLANTLLRNPLQRQVVPGLAKAYHTLASRNPDPGTTPFFYLSASPRQLQRILQSVLDHNGFPRGVLMTKRITNDRTSDPLRNQHAYKTAKIENILARVPHVRFTLIGDDTERDPEVFEHIRREHPHRVESIWIRRVHPSRARPRFAGQEDLATLLR
jgi:phosphatidate phosphatase APP1